MNRQHDTAVILTPEAVAFLEELHLHFEPRRQQLLLLRMAIQEQVRQGRRPHLLEETKNIRTSEWQTETPPPDLLVRQVEITGPAEPKMMINALNSGADVFMADLEDALAPTFDNLIAAQIALKSAVQRTLQFDSTDGKQYRLNEKLATLMVRPRGWHLNENHLCFLDEDGHPEPMSGALFDFGLYVFHNAHELKRRGTGAYLYLPKLENHLEARLWSDVFSFSEKFLGLEAQSIRATVLIETIFAAFEMEEILFELKDYITGLNAGRWDYLFSLIKKFSFDSELIFPNRDQLTMNVPFMRAYAKTLVMVCQRRGAMPIGGMAAFIPSRKDEQINQRAILKVQEDKRREANDGFVGTWVAHPDLVPVARAAFESKGPPQKSDQMQTGVEGSAFVRQRDELDALSQQLLPRPAGLTVLSEGRITEAGIRNNISVALQYLSAWLSGQGALAINHLMEDAATAEIARAELWQWCHHHASFVPTAESSGRLQKFDSDLFQKFVSEEAQGLSQFVAINRAVHLLSNLVMDSVFAEFLTTTAYPFIEDTQKRHWLPKRTLSAKETQHASDASANAEEKSESKSFR